MLLNEIAQPCDYGQLDEGWLSGLIAGAGLVLGALVPSITSPDVKVVPGRTINTTADPAKLVNAISSKYRVDRSIIIKIIQSAVAYQYSDFPKARDILAVVGTESSYQPSAKSHLKRDPAIGLMQTRPGVWGMSPRDFKDIDSQISIGAKILHDYYIKLGSREAALHAYNVGIGNHKKSIKDPKFSNPRYVPKIDAEGEFVDSAQANE